MLHTAIAALIVQFTFRPAIITVSIDRVLRISSSGFFDKTIRSAHLPVFESS